MSVQAPVASDLRSRWGAFESAWKKHRDMEGLFTRGGMPSNITHKLQREGVAASVTPAVQPLDVGGPFALYGMTIKTSVERRPSLQVAGRASSVLKTNSFVSGSMLEQDAVDVMGSYGELGKAWRYASRAIQNQCPEVNVVMPFSCDRSATVGTSQRFGTVQVHKGVWSIPEGGEQGTLRVRRATISMDGNVVAETTNFSMRKSPDSPITSISLTCTLINPDSDEVRRHAINAGLQKAIDEEMPVLCNVMLGFPQPVACYGVPGDIVEGNPACPVQNGISGLIGLKLSCKYNGEGRLKEGVLTMLHNDLGSMNATFGICNEDQLKAAVFNGKSMDLVVVTTMTCLPCAMVTS